MKAKSKMYPWFYMETIDLSVWQQRRTIYITLRIAWSVGCDVTVYKHENE